MRTTVRIDDSLLAEAKALGTQTGRTVGEVIEDALRELLARRATQEAARRRVRLPTFAGNGLLPGIDLDSSAALLDLMDDEGAVD